MGKEQELRLDGFAEKLAAALSERRVKLRDLEAEIGVSKSATSRAARGKSVSAENFVALWNWLRRSSSDEAEVVAAKWMVVRNGELVLPLLHTEAEAKRYASVHDEEVAPLYRAPAGAAGGVTEEMVDRAMDRAAWTVKPSPAEYETGGGALIDLGMSQDEADHLNAELRGEMREILTAALTVGDEGMGEGKPNVG